MKTIYLGIDNGNYNTKSSDHILYPSGFAVQDREFITSDQQLSYGGKHYAIGDHRMSFQQEKAHEQDTFLLSLPMLANAMKLEGVNEADFVLGVGLPDTLHYVPQKSGSRVAARPPRGVTVMLSRGRCLAVNQAGRLWVQGEVLVDIGGYTVDVMTMENSRPIRSSCISLRKGTIVLSRERCLAVTPVGRL